MKGPGIKIKLLPFLVLLGFLACKEKETVKRPKGKSPNIVFIMSDDHAYQAISAYGHEIGKIAPTPNIDRIAQNGAKFNRAYVTNSICGPSRAVILTGKHSHINGFRQNGERFDGSQPTLPKYLKMMGYQTAIVGKWHLHDWPQGFDYWNILQDQGNYYNPDFIDNGDSIRVAGYTNDLITDKALSWLKEKRDSTPFLLMVQHKAPHRNWMPALRHANKYDSIDIPIPETYFAEHDHQQAAGEQQQTIYKDMYEGHDLKLTRAAGSLELANNPWPSDFGRMTEQQRAQWNAAYQPKNEAFHKAKLSGKELALWKGQRYLQDYLATVASVDEGVGKVLDYLEASGLDENTIVVYTSDQGFYLGEKGWFDKRFMYEESFRTPLLIQYPGVIEKGKQVDAMVQNLDFAQTLLDFVGGGEYSSGMQGASLVPLLTNTMEEEDFRDIIYYHYYDYPAFHMVKKHYGVRTKRYKLIHFYDDIDSWEFYDLREDPKELDNKMDDAAYQDIIKTMKVRLDSVQRLYKVTEKEFGQAPKEKVEKAFETFKKLRGTPMQ
ncbi:sulfatase [Muricauda sp. SCSIO 64092]|uniref:sulfatase family protein n=1 Tax=Allomuricauda sp. SCSIO 64092 TaxID=2908842 RepID=UPI001FF5E6E0|nr:sulfatase [Muricauda sp. SCSIO 64092]UOY05855.1 sulfatase [Muricauda sp. SCSIO 64092]